MPPLALRRLAWGAILLGAVCGATATALRDSLPIDAPHRSATYLLDTLGWVLALVGAVGEARTTARLMEAAVRSARRRALLLTVVGVLVCLLGCVVASEVSTRHGAIRALGAGALVAGLGAGLGGGFALAWHYGLEYASERLDKRDPDD